MNDAPKMAKIRPARVQMVGMSLELILYLGNVLTLLALAIIHRSEHVGLPMLFRLDPCEHRLQPPQDVQGFVAVVCAGRELACW